MSTVEAIFNKPLVFYHYLSKCLILLDQFELCGNENKFCLFLEGWTSALMAYGGKHM